MQHVVSNNSLVKVSLLCASVLLSVGQKHPGTAGVIGGTMLVMLPQSRKAPGLNPDWSLLICITHII